MKRKCIVWLLIGLMAASLLAGCGDKSADTEAAADWALQELPLPEEDAPLGTGYEGNSASSAPAAPADDDAKIIYTADLALETTDLDGADAAIKALTEDCGGYFSSSSMSNDGESRIVRRTVRVPAEKYRDFLDRAGQTAQLLELEEHADDVSEEYYDVDGRLKTQQAKLDRLRELLDTAQSMEDIIAIESAVSETEEQIDRLSGQLRWYDARVDYATVNIAMREVSRLSGTAGSDRTFGGRVLSALKEGLHGFADRMEDLLLALAYGWEWIVLGGAVLAAALLLIRRSLRRRRAKKEK